LASAHSVATRCVGRSLFTARIVLPSNATIGPFETRVCLFREEKLLSQYNLERVGLQQTFYGLAYGLSNGVR
jgi:hypothetical protein